MSENTHVINTGGDGRVIIYNSNKSDQPPSKPSSPPKGALLYKELYHVASLGAHFFAYQFARAPYVIGVGLGSLNALKNYYLSGTISKPSEDAVAYDFGQASSFWEKFSYIGTKFGTVFGASFLELQQACGVWYGFNMGQDLTERVITWLNPK